MENLVVGDTVAARARRLDSGHDVINLSRGDRRRSEHPLLKQRTGHGRRIRERDKCAIRIARTIVELDANSKNGVRDIGIADALKDTVHGNILHRGEAG